MPDLLKKLQQTKILSAPPCDRVVFQGKHLSPVEMIHQLLEENSDPLRAWHQEWLEAGAHALLTHSLQMNRPTLAEYGITDSINHLNWLAASVAAGVAKEKKLLVGGMVAPLPEGKWSSSERLTFYIEQIGALLDGGSQFILFYGFSQLPETETAIEALRNLHHCPAVVLWNDCGKVDNALADKIRDAGADVFGALGNPHQLNHLLPSLIASPDTPLGAGFTGFPLNLSDVRDVIHHGASLVILPPGLGANDCKFLGKNGFPEEKV